MRDVLLLLFPVVLAATRSLSFGIQSPSRGMRPTITAETEFEFLLIAICCLTGLLVSLYLMTRFPELGAIITEYNQF